MSILTAHRSPIRTGLAALSVLGLILPATPIPVVDRTLAALDALYAVTMDHGGHRASGSPGYDAAAQFVEDELTAAGYEVRRQPFAYDRWTTVRQTLRRLGPNQADLPNQPVQGTTASPTGGLQGRLQAPADATGCTADAWEGIARPGMIALLRFGGCTLEQQLAVASEAGAVSAVVSGEAPGMSIRTVDPSAGLIPAANTLGSVADALREELDAPDAEPIDVLVDVERNIERRETTNLIAERNVEDGEPLTMAGAHLDSVAAGPGMNDDGSGVAALLALAVTAAESGSDAPLRFAWWGGEEDGVKGSTHYVQDLIDGDPADLARIEGYVNLEMLGSVNYVVNVGAGSGDDVPVGAAAAAHADGPADGLRALLDEVGQPWIAERFGQSDFSPFDAAGIPVADVSGGAGAPKTDEQAALFGGTVGEPMDPNYHRPGDDRSNVSEEPLRIFLPILERYLLG